MNFAFSEEQDAFRAEIRRFVSERWPLAQVRRLMDTPAGFDRAIWKQMAQELGLQGVAIGEAHGGQGFGFLELGIVLEELGRELSGGPFFATTCLAVPALQRLASEQQKSEWLGAIAAGELVATLALDETSRAATPETLQTRAERDGDGWRLSGRKRFVIDGHNADLLLVVARLHDRARLFALRGDASGLHASQLETLDPTRKLADLGFDNAAATLVGEGEDAWPQIQQTLDVAAIGMAAECTGASAACLDRSVAYAKQRMQFARPIGSFQAIKHKASEVLLEIELARAVAYWSWWAADSDEVELGEAASVAKSVVGDAFMRASRENIQIHGGMGYTWENDAHLFYKRARSSDTLLGSSGAHRLRLAERLGFPGPGLPGAS